MGFFPWENDHANNGFSVCIGTDKIPRTDVVKFWGTYIANKLIWNGSHHTCQLKNI